MADVLIVKVILVCYPTVTIQVFSLYYREATFIVFVYFNSTRNIDDNRANNTTVKFGFEKFVGTSVVKHNFIKIALIREAI